MNQLNYHYLDNEVLSFSTFISAVTTALSQKYPGDTFSPQSVLKNNGTALTGVVIKRANSNFAPTVYLNHSYDSYCSGSSTFSDVISSICDVIENPQIHHTFDSSCITDFEKARSRICYKLINREQNLELLSTLPHRFFLDLAVVYFVCLDCKEAETASVMVTNELMEKLYETDEETLFQLASINTPLLFGDYSMKSLFSVLSGLTDEELQLKGDTSISPALYVITNEKAYWGAAALLDATLLKECSERLNSSYYILPSSIHECLLVPDSPSIFPTGLTAMVREVNETQVAIEERLSNRVYRYNRNNNDIEITE